MRHDRQILRSWNAPYIQLMIDSDIGKLRHNGKGMECAQRILHVNSENASGLRKGTGIRKRQRTTCQRRTRQSNLSLGHKYFDCSNG